MLLWRSVVAAAVLILPTAVVAQTDAKLCNAALAQDIFHTVNTSRQQYAFISTMEEEVFNRLKLNASATAHVPIVGKLIGMSNDFDHFKENRQRLFKEEAYAEDVQKAEQTLHVFTNPVAYPFWAQCMRDFATRNIGFTAWKEFESRELVVVSYYFNAPPGRTTVGTFGAVNGGSVSGADSGKVFAAGTKFDGNSAGSFQVVRSTPGAPVTITLGVEGYPGSTVSSAWREEAATPPQTIVGNLVVTSTWPKSTEEFLGVRSAKGVSADNHNESCKKNPCSPGGEWQASSVSLVLPKGKDVVLRDAMLLCDGMPDAVRDSLPQAERFSSGEANRVKRNYQNVCAFTWGTGPVATPGNGIVRVPMPLSATAHAYTHPTQFTLRANAYRVKMEKPDVKVANVQLEAGQYFSFLVPSVPGVATEVELKTNRGSVAFAPGSNSPDGLLRFVSTVPVKEGIRYNYVVRPQVAPPAPTTGAATPTPP